MNRGKKALIIVLTDIVLLVLLVASIYFKINNKSDAIDNLCTAFIVVLIPTMFLVTFSVATVDKYDFDHPKGVSYDEDDTEEEKED